MADDKDRDPLAVLGRLADKNAKPESRFADLAHGPKDEWQPGKKLYLSKHDPVPMSADLERVLALPERDQLDLSTARAEGLVELMTNRWSRGERVCACAQIDARIAAGKRKCLKRLKPVQAWALYELGIVGGLLGSLPVGSGKTLINLLAPLALEPLGAKLCVLLVPPTLLEQLYLDYKLIAEHFRVPAITIHGLEKRVAVANAPALHVIPYSRLSLHTSSVWIRELRPDAIIADEVHRLRDPEGAGASRIMRYFEEFGDTRFAGWTGSLTDGSLSDYAHLAALALRMQSPLPLAKGEVLNWGRALDEGPNPGPPGELARLCGEDLDPDNIDDLREGFRRRITRTMGFVVSVEASVDVDLIIKERPAPPIPAIITEALHKVRSCWVRPDTLVGSEYDEELTDAFAVAKVARELASGIFYRWRFDPIHGVPQRQADIDEWYQARRDYNRELRYFIADRREWLDSDMLCMHAAMRFWGDRPKRDDRPEWRCSSWPRWREIKDKVKPTVEPCRVSDYLAVDAARWGLEHKGIVWYQMSELGEWISELSGLPFHDGGPNASVRLMGGERKGKKFKGETGDRSIVASLKSHGTGRDGLQSLFCEQLFTQLPTSASMVEQSLGRLHRQGQNEPEVRAWYYLHTDEYKAAYIKMMGRTRNVKGTLGQTQKIQLGR